MGLKMDSSILWMKTAMESMIVACGKEDGDTGMEVSHKVKTRREKETNPIPNQVKRKRTPEKRKRGNDILSARRIIPFIILLIVAFPRLSFGWFHGNLGLEETWTDNVFLLSDPEQDWITSPFLSMDFGPFAGWSPYLSLAGNLYADNNDLNGTIQSIGIEYGRGFGKGDIPHSFLFGLGYTGTSHVEQTRYLDYHEVGSNLGFSLRPQNTLLIRPEVYGKYRTFPNEENLSFIETGLSFLLNKSFPSATTLRFFGRIDYKQFLQDVETDSDILDSQQAALVQQTPSSSGTSALPPLYAGQNGSGQQGPGQGSDNNSGSGSGSQGSENSNSSGSGRDRMAGGTGQAGSVGSLQNSDSIQAAQTYVAIRVAQSFAGKAGMYLQGSYRTNLLDPPRYVEGLLSAVEREIFDDNYGYQGPGAASQISVIMLPGFSWKIRGEYEMRRYEDRDALDENGFPLDPKEERLDHRIDAVTGLSYTHYFDLVFPAMIQAGLDYGHVWNVSNDAFYDARENWCLISFSLGW
jgi:hypothetical protein